jgi:hypothetical protein
VADQKALRQCRGQDGTSSPQEDGEYDDEDTSDQHRFRWKRRLISPFIGHHGTSARNATWDETCFSNAETGFLFPAHGVLAEAGQPS